MANPQLLEYVESQIQSGFAPSVIRKVLLDNEWKDPDIDEVFTALNILESNTVIAANPAPSPETPSSSTVQIDTYSGEKLTIDKIIEKFIPIAGAIFLVIGLGYLLYTTAWVHFSMQIRLGLGFFASLVIIGGSYSLSEKMRYFTDIGIGSGVLMMYATLIYGSRTTDMSQAIIPEVVTLFTALIFTLVVSYFASKRNSKVILILAMIGAYITPFVIGQSDVWVQNISFNSYLIYFFAINISVFLMGRQISVRDIIPLNIAGLYIGVSALWNLSYTENINSYRAGDFFSGELFTSMIFVALVVFSIWSILLSAKRFNENDDGYLSLGYIAPIIWFMFNIDNLKSISETTIGVLYAVIAVSCFTGWYVLLGTKTRFQHGALYAAGLLSAILAFFSFFEHLDVYTSILIAYSSLIFAVIYIFDSTKTERFVSFIAISFMGSVLSLRHIVGFDFRFETLWVVLALVPAMSAYFVAKLGKRTEFFPYAKVYSFCAAIIASMFVLQEFLEYIDLGFLLFYVAPLCILAYIAFSKTPSEDQMSHDSKSRILRVVLFWFAFGFFEVFFSLIESIYPAPANTFLFSHFEMPTDWIMIKGIFATIILFVGLMISRRLQKEQVIKRPSFVLVIFGFTTLLLTGNYLIYAIMNDLLIPVTQGGPRAIATTIWWVLIAIYMLFVGVKYGKKYYAEKLLGLILLALATCKMIFYDMEALEMNYKIIVLMVIGGAMLIFSYFIKSKDLLDNHEDVQLPG